jgi:hypothetical protein
MPTTAEAAEHAAAGSNRHFQEEPEAHGSKSVLDSELELATEEIVLLSILQALDDADFSSAVATIPKVKRHLAS